MLWFPLPVRVYLKPAVSKIFMVFAVAPPTSGGWLLDVKAKRRKGIKKVVRNFVRLRRKKGRQIYK